MRYFYEVKYFEDHLSLDLISVGIVCSDNRTYYAVNRTADWNLIFRHSWLMENVVPQLPLLTERHLIDEVLGSCPIDVSSSEVKWKSVIAREVFNFLLDDGSGRELWSWDSSYVHVALSQLLQMIPSSSLVLPSTTYSIKQEAVRLGSPILPIQTSAQHHALADARHNKVMLEYLEGIEAKQLTVASQWVACCPMDEETSAEVLELMRSTNKLGF